MIQRTAQSGFSAVELLISLFIAVAFVGAGYQLYGVVIRDGSDAKLRARANDIAYDRLRIYSTQITSMCTAVPLTPTLPTPSNLPNATISASITCPYGSDPISKVSVTVSYGTPQQGVTHASFVKK